MTAIAEETVISCEKTVTELENKMNENMIWWQFQLATKMTPEERVICVKQIKDMTEMFYRVFGVISDIMMNARHNVNRAEREYGESSDELELEQCRVSRVRYENKLYDEQGKSCASLDHLTKIRQEKFEALNLARVMHEAIKTSHSRLVKTRDAVDSF